MNIDDHGRVSIRNRLTLVFKSFLADECDHLALHQHAGRQIGCLKRVPRRTRVRVREHRQPFFVDVRSQGAILEPHVDLGYIFGNRSRSLEDFTDGSEHLCALRLDAVQVFAGIGLLAGHAAGNQKWSDAARGWNGIIVLESLYFDADASTHDEVPSSSIWMPYFRLMELRLLSSAASCGDSASSSWTNISKPPGMKVVKARLGVVPGFRNACGICRGRTAIAPATA